MHLSMSTLMLIFTFLSFWNNLFLSINAKCSSEKRGSTKLKKTLPSKPDWQVVNGSRAYIADFPFSAFVYREIKISETQIQTASCGGSIISENHVLTACHCVITNSKIVPEKYYSIVVGTDYIENRLFFLAMDIYQVQNIAVPSDCFFLTGIRDIAVLKVAKPFKLSNKVQPIKLPEGVVDIKAMQNSKEVCYLAGFGLTGVVQNEFFPIYFNTLPITIDNIKFCMFSQTYQMWVSDDKHICGNNKYAYTSFGDSGSGLVCGTGENRYILGIDSLGTNDPLEQPSYTLFTRVDANLDFVRKEANLFKKVSGATSLNLTLHLEHLVTVLYIYTYLIPVMTITAT